MIFIGVRRKICVYTNSLYSYEISSRATMSALSQLVTLTKSALPELGS